MMMNKCWHVILTTLALLYACDAYADIVYVSATDGNDSNNGSSWTLAKQTIQAGVDAAASNDTVLVTNGTYNTGGRIPPGQILCQTRVVIDKAVSVISVNGPSNTFIVGQGPRSETAVRCVWMTSNAYLVGFTVTNGFTVTGVGGDDENGGGIFADGYIYESLKSSMVSNCIIISCQAFSGAGAYGCMLNNCSLIGNLATNIGSEFQYSLGGGAFYSVLNNCEITSNSTESAGGGTEGGTLNNCTLSGNSAGYGGGGANGSTLNNCTLIGNSARVYGGGGALSCMLNNCTLSGNMATNSGGGANGGTLNNCTIVGNSVVYGYGGGTTESVVNNCTAFGNTNGGIYSGTARNTISYGNTEFEMKNVSAAYCYTNNPLFVNAAAGNLRLQPASPCINSGYNSFAPTNETPYDLDGNPRIAQLTVDKGAYEYQGIEFYDLFASSGPHGAIIPSGVIRTNQGADVPFAIQPDAYYHVQNVLTNGGSAGTETNFTWYNLSGPGTVTVSFAATLATRGTPHWWLAQWGWTNDFDIVEALDQDGDGLFTWEEYPHNTCPTNANTDGDQYTDGVEVGAGADPLQDDSQTYGAMLTHPASFNLYTSNSVLDLSYGEVMLNVVSNTIQVSLTMQSTDLLDGDGWTNVGTAVEWECPADLNKSFFRFLGTPVE